MKPEHETRRKIIREWMSLPKDKRQTEEQAKLFAKKAMEQIPSSGDPYRQIMKWLLPASISRDLVGGSALSALQRPNKANITILNGKLLLVVEDRTRRAQNVPDPRRGES
jgi:hypothetical protein